MKSPKNKSNVLSVNKRAGFDYELIDNYTAGLVLVGHEAKSVRAGNAELRGAYVTMKNNELWLTNATIHKYKHATTIHDYDEQRPRKLLVTSRERESLMQAKADKLNIIPLRIIAAGPYLKLVIATARSKKKYDKRQSIKKRDVERDRAATVRRYEQR